MIELNDKDIELKVFRAKEDIKIDCIINNQIFGSGILLHIPTVDEVYEYGESQFFNMIHTLNYVGIDLSWQLYDIGIEFPDIYDFELFYCFLLPMFSEEQLSIIIKNIDVSHTVKTIYYNEENQKEEVLLYDEKNNVIITEKVYADLITYIRKMYGLKRNDETPANRKRMMKIIDLERERYQLFKNQNANKKNESELKSLISAMVNSSGFKYDYETVWNMKITHFFDAVKRISKIKQSDLLLQSGYSGFGIDLKKIDKNELDWTGDV